MAQDAPNASEELLERIRHLHRHVDEVTEAARRDHWQAVLEAYEALGASELAKRLEIRCARVYQLVGQAREGDG